MANRIGDTLVVTLPADCDAELIRALAVDAADLVYAHRDHRVVFDASSVELLDVEDASELVAMVRTVRLLGARAIVAGLRPALVAALISLDVDLGGIDCALDLAAAVENA